MIFYHLFWLVKIICLLDLWLSWKRCGCGANRIANTHTHIERWAVEMDSSLMNSFSVDNIMNHLPHKTLVVKREIVMSWHICLCQFAYQGNFESLTSLSISNGFDPYANVDDLLNCEDHNRLIDEITNDIVLILVWCLMVTWSTSFLMQLEIFPPKSLNYPSLRSWFLCCCYKVCWQTNDIVLVVCKSFTVDF